MSIHHHYSKLLIPEEPLQVLPALATEIGLNEAIILQQLHYWMNPRRNQGAIHNGRRWIYNTYQQWQDNFPFWSVDTIKRTINKLEQNDLIESTDRFNADTRDRTKWYTINYGNAILHGGEGNLHPSTSDAICPGGEGNLPHSTTKQRLHSETTAETTSTHERKSIYAEYQQALFDKWYSHYPKKVGKAAAHKAFRKIIKTVALDTLIDAVELHKTSAQWTRDNGQFIPNPSTWLNQHRWEDEVVVAATEETTAQRLAAQARREREEYEQARSHGSSGGTGDSVAREEDNRGNEHGLFLGAGRREQRPD